MSKEFYKNHFLRNLSKFIIFTVLILVLFCILIPFEIYLNNNDKQYNYFSNCSYDYVIESKQDYQFNNKFYKIESINSISKNDRHLGVVTYIQEEKNNIVNQKLNKNEIIINANVAKSLNVSVNDEIFLELISNEEAISYLVKDIIYLPEDLYNINEDILYNVVFISDYDEVIANNKGSYCYFLSNEEYNIFMGNNYSYSHNYNIYDDLHYLKNKIIISYCVLFIIAIILLSIINVSFFKYLSNENKKYSKDNFSSKIIKKINFIDSIIYVFIPFIIILILDIILYIFDYISVLTISFMGLIMILLLFNLIGGYIKWKN